MTLTLLLLLLFTYPFLLLANRPTTSYLQKAMTYYNKKIHHYYTSALAYCTQDTLFYHLSTCAHAREGEEREARNPLGTKLCRSIKKMHHISPIAQRASFAVTPRTPATLPQVLSQPTSCFLQSTSYKLFHQILQVPHLHRTDPASPLLLTF